jgi:hypothetical protein
LSTNQLWSDYIQLSCGRLNFEIRLRVHVTFTRLGDIDPAKLGAMWTEAKAVLADAGYVLDDDTGPLSGWFRPPPDPPPAYVDSSR